MTSALVKDAKLDTTTLVKYNEYVCNEKKNYARMRQGYIPNGFQCLQLVDTVVMSLDVFRRPINETIEYRSGCELRRLNDVN